MKKAIEIITFTFAFISTLIFTLVLLAHVAGANKPILMLITGAFAFVCVLVYFNRDED